MKNQQKIKRLNFLFLILFLFSTSLLSLQTLKKVNVKDIRIYGSELFSKNDLINNSSLRFPTRLIFIKTKYLEEELKQNLSLKNISITRQIFPFGLNIQIKTRTPIAFGKKFLNDKKILGYIDKDGFFINTKNADKKYLNKLTIEVSGWKNKFKETLSVILTSQENYEFEFLKITFSTNGFLTVYEKELKTILLGFNPNLIKSQLQTISNLKNEFKRINFSEKIDTIDLRDPNKPKIKVFKP